MNCIAQSEGRKFVRKCVRKEVRKLNLKSDSFEQFGSNRLVKIINIKKKEGNVEGRKDMEFRV